MRIIISSVVAIAALTLASPAYADPCLDGTWVGSGSPCMVGTLPDGGSFEAQQGGVPINSGPAVGWQETHTSGTLPDGGSFEAQQGGVPINSGPAVGWRDQHTTGTLPPNSLPCSGIAADGCVP